MKFGLTQPFPCSYLPEKYEQLLVFVTDEPNNQRAYDKLIRAGFRRSGEQIYRPQCLQCQSCHSIRIPVEDFCPSKSQKRILKRNRGLEVRLSQSESSEYYPLYERYINGRHSDGSMYPASRQQYDSFIHASWSRVLFMEITQNDNLVGVAVMDKVENALSALYTFFHPELADQSIGTYSILQQIQLAKTLGKDYLYLGYQIDECKKMNYKAKFFPHERFFNNSWVEIRKNPV